MLTFSSLRAGCGERLTSVVEQSINGNVVQLKSIIKDNATYI